MLVALLPISILAQSAAGRLPSVDASRLTPGTVSGIIYAVHEGDTVEAGGYAEELRVDALQVVLVRTTFTRLFGQTVDSVVDLQPDLRPLLYAETAPKLGSLHVTFQGTRATGWSRGRDGELKEIDAAVPAGAWSIPSLLLVLEASDLQDGASFSFPAFYPGGDSSAIIDAVVTGAEAVKRRDCWVVSASRATVIRWGRSGSIGRPMGLDGRPSRPPRGSRSSSR